MMRNTPAVEHPGQQSEDCAVGCGEFRTSGLALEHDELVPQREDFGVALVAGGEQPSEPCEDEFREGAERVHGSATVSGRCPKTPEL